MNKRAKIIALFLLVIIVVIGLFSWIKNGRDQITSITNVEDKKEIIKVTDNSNSKTSIVPSDPRIENFLYPYEDNGKWGYMNCHGQTIIIPQFDEGAFFYEGRAAVSRESQDAVIDTKGNIIVPYGKYQFINRFTSGLAAVMSDSKSGKIGYIDLNGRLVIPINYYPTPTEGFANVFVGDYAVVEVPAQDPKGYRDMCLINKKGEVLIRHPYYFTFSEDGTCLTYRGYNNQLGLMDFSGNILADAKLNIHSYSEGLAVVRANFKVGFMNNKGETIIEPIYEEAGAFSEGLAAIKINKLWGFINKQGETIIDSQFVEVRSFSEDLAVVKVDKKYGYIDRVGNIVIEPQFDYAWSFTDGQAIVGLKSEEPGIKFGYIQPDGTFILKPDFKYSSQYIYYMIPPP